LAVIERALMKHYPLLFDSDGIVLGNRFLASVSMHGRVLASQEEDGWWLYGVRPGDLAAGGKDFAEARAEFDKSLTAVLHDIAEEAVNPDHFVQEIRRFFDGISEPTEKEWQAALDGIRAGRIVEALATENLPVQPGDSPRFVDVRILELDDIKPQDPQDAQLALAA
jgi:hypothetical protein